MALTEQNVSKNPTGELLVHQEALKKSSKSHFGYYA